MKVTFHSQDLSRALEKVQRAAQTKVTSNTNNGFFIACDGEKAEFQANDYSIGISSRSRQCKKRECISGRWR